MQKSKTKHKQVEPRRRIAGGKSVAPSSPPVIPLPPALAARLAKADSQAAVSVQERKLGLEAAREIKSSPGNSTLYENPEDFFEVVRKMKDKNSG